MRASTCPTTSRDVEDVVEALLGPARRHGLSKVVFVVYDDDTAVADEVAWSLLESFTAAGIEVFDVLRVHDGHYFAVLPGREPGGLPRHPVRGRAPPASRPRRSSAAG